MNTTRKRLAPPRSQSAAILRLFLRRKTWTRWELEKWTGSSYPPARIKNLRQAGIRFADEFRSGVNKFGHTYNYRVWTLLSERDTAKSVYIKINPHAKRNPVSRPR
jgi:hypothetical protein